MRELDGLIWGCAILIVVCFGILILSSCDDTPLCRHGWQYDRIHGKQILNENGGGIKCSAQ